MKLFALEIQNLDSAQVFAHLQHLPYALLLDSADREHPDARYSFICAFPIETIEAKNNVITVSSAKEQVTYEGDPFAVLNDRIGAQRLSQETIEDLPPFQGGVAGFFGYDLGRAIEHLPQIAADNPNMLDMAVGIYDQVIAFDHEQQRTWIITHADHQARAQQRQKILFDLLEQPPQTGASAPLEWKNTWDAEQYQAAVQKVIDYIHAGDVFQANLAQRFDADLPDEFCAYRHYMNLRTVNSAPFACFMNLDNIKISSASPERFLSIKNNLIETRPIKGTAPRSDDQKQDKKNQTRLLNSEKDKAENTMIVDLLRNDLSKVCVPESVEVVDLCKLESFAKVHHLVSTVRGKLRDEFKPLDLLRACFPGGSITGAPKIRAMEIIEELEPARRGPYCGSMGYIGINGAMDSNILIRTLIYEGKTVNLSVGGGIVSDSEPAAEYQETLDKGEAIFRSFDTEKSDEKVAAE